MSEHSSVMGGSTAGRGIACPGSIELAAGMPKQPTNEPAARGTVLHEIIEKLIQADPDQPEGDPDTYVGTYECDGHTIEVTQDLIEEKIVPAIDFFDDLDPDEFWIEQKVSHKDEPGAFGTADVIYKKKMVHTGEIVGGLLDWKFGDGIMVNVETSKQFPFYMSAALEMGFFKGCTKLVADVYQPAERLQRDAYHQRREWLPEELKAFKKEMKAALKNARSSNPTLSVGDHCEWCPVRAENKCPAIKDLVSTAEGTNVKGLDLDDIAYWLDKVSAIEGWIKELRSVAHAAAEDGATIPGFKMVAGRSVRKWVNAEKADGVLARAGVPKADRYVSKFVGIPAAEKLMKKHKPASVKLLERHIEKPEGKPTLVREDAPGAPLVNMKGTADAIVDQMEAKKLTTPRRKPKAEGDKPTKTKRSKPKKVK